MSENAGIEIKKSQIQGAGNGLFAKNALSAGDLIVSVDRPLVLELEAGRAADTCAWCCQRAATDPVERSSAAAMGLPSGFVDVKSCTGCKQVAYCSKTCQSKAWKREHKHECKTLSAKQRPDLPPGVRAAIKFLGRLKANPDSEIVPVRQILSVRPAGDPNGLNEIASQDKKKFDSLRVLADAAWHFAGEPNITGLDSRSTSAGLVFNIMSNAIILSSPFDSVQLGIAFDPVISSANHSCEPNAILVFNQPQLAIRALRPIKAGEEILVSYLDATDPYDVRQARLENQYLFKCRCNKCEKGGALEANQFVEKAKKWDSKYCQLADKLVTLHEPELAKLSISGRDVETQRRAFALQMEAYSTLVKEDADVDDVKEAIQLCIESGLWSWARQPVPQLCRRLMDLYFKSGAIYQAFRVGIKLHVEILPAVYAEEFHPERLLNAWQTSTLINVLCGPAYQELYQELARGGVDLRLFYFGFLFYVYDNTPKMYGLESPFGQVIDKTYTQIMGGVSMPKADIEGKVKSIWSTFESVSHNVDLTNF